MTVKELYWRRGLSGDESHLLLDVAGDCAPLNGSLIRRLKLAIPAVQGRWIVRVASQARLPTGYLEEEDSSY